MKYYLHGYYQNFIMRRKVNLQEMCIDLIKMVPKMPQIEAITMIYRQLLNILMKEVEHTNQFIFLFSKNNNHKEMMILSSHPLCRHFRGLELLEEHRILDNKELAKKQQFN